MADPGMRIYTAVNIAKDMSKKRVFYEIQSVFAAKAVLKGGDRPEELCPRQAIISVLGLPTNKE